MIITNKVKERFYKKVGPDWQWLGRKNKDGYGIMMIVGKKERAHRVSYKIHTGEIPDGMLVLHSCDTPDCVNPAHLHLGTHQDNMRERSERGRTREQNGEKNYTSKLTEKEVLEIRNKYKVGARQHVLAKEYKVSRQLIGAIVNLKAWKHI